MKRSLLLTLAIGLASALLYAGPAKRVPKMKKLLKFEIADGLENRTIVSGIAMHYEPEALVGKQVCFIANLPPREFKGGLVSQGMILSAVNCDGTLSVITPERKVAAGSSVC